MLHAAGALQGAPRLPARVQGRHAARRARRGPPQVLIKLLALALLPLNNSTLNLSDGKVISVRNVVLAALLALLAIAAACCLVTIGDVEKLRDSTTSTTSSPAEEPRDRSQACTRPRVRADKAVAAITLWFKKPQVVLLAPVQASFGLCAALLASFVAPDVIKPAYPSSQIVVSSCMFALVAATVAPLETATSI